MVVTAVKTRKVLAGSCSLNELLDESLGGLEEKSVLAITSKVAAICENRVVPIGTVEKAELVKRESDYFIDPSVSKYNMSFTISHHTLVPVAGIDESNGNGNYVLWPGDPQKTANQVRAYLQKRFGLKNVGVILTDSTARPLHYGTEGVAIGYSGFSSSNSYVGQPDLFGRAFQVSIANIVDALASAAVLVMGEGTEQTPLAIIEDVPAVKFQDHDPTPDELKQFFLEHMEDDLFEPFLKNAPWQKGDQKQK
ncbi:MAG TPA: coenzyme F420-0:L-glutamate ligase [Candidatus Binatia bacterium]|nr:coenzyme F420-0:L-glutamate ligase [Candidatus Binatia bacterium]